MSTGAKIGVGAGVVSALAAVAAVVVSLWKKDAIREWWHRSSAKTQPTASHSTAPQMANTVNVVIGNQELTR